MRAGFCDFHSDRRYCRRSSLVEPHVQARIGAVPCRTERSAQNRAWSHYHNMGGRKHERNNTDDVFNLHNRHGNERAGRLYELRQRKNFSARINGRNQAAGAYKADSAVFPA